MALPIALLLALLALIVAAIGSACVPAVRAERLARVPVRVGRAGRRDR